MVLVLTVPISKEISNGGSGGVNMSGEWRVVLMLRAVADGHEVVTGRRSGELTGCLMSFAVCGKFRENSGRLALRLRVTRLLRCKLLLPFSNVLIATLY